MSMAVAIRDSDRKENNVDLIKEILNVRYTDLKEEERLCKQLLREAEADGDNYGCAFANVYLLDSFLAQGDLTACDFYLVRAAFLCSENGYDDLRKILCVFAGTYYLNLGDEQSALEYYLDGLKIARRMEDYDTESKLLNNIGIGFGARDGWAFAKKYFQKAVSIIESHLKEADRSNEIGVLSNLAEACQKLGDIGGSWDALRKCESVESKGDYHQLVQECGWCVHYMVQRDWEKCIKMADHILSTDLIDSTQRYFVCDMCVGLCECMLQIDNREQTKKFLHILETLSKNSSLMIQYRYQCVKIFYQEKYGDSQRLLETYQKYYELLKQLEEIEKEARAQSMLSKVQLTKVQMEREEMKERNKELEYVGKIDSLTGLYNRRYFNKLASKLNYSEHVQTIGVVMVDVDYFKGYNDFYGHFKGDEVLKIIASILKVHMEEGIYVSRYGGDEFVCVCVDLSDEKLEEYVKKVYYTVDEKRIPHENSPISSYLSLSIGYTNETSARSVHEILLGADQALYQVKEAGRNSFGRKRLDS